MKEVWKVAKPLRRVVHTLGWPLRPQAKYHEFGGSFIYPMGDDMLTIGMVVGLDYRDAELSVHDLLQQLKTHPFVRKMLAGGERVGWGAKTIPEGGFVALPSRLHAPGLLMCGDGAGLVNVPALKGIHYAVESGHLAAEAAVDALRPGGRRGRPERSASTTMRSARASSGATSRKSATCARRSAGLLHGRRPRRRDDREQGQAPARGPIRPSPTPRSGRPHGPAPRATRPRTAS